MSVEVLPSGWLAPARLGDRLVVEPDALVVRLGGRTTRLPADRLARASVWRDPYGRRVHRIEDASGALVAVLVDQQWRLPGEGRLAPLLRRLGCRVVSTAAPEGPEGVGAQRVAGSRQWAPSSARTWATLAGLVVVLLTIAAGSVLRPRVARPDWYAELVAAAAVAMAGYLVLLVLAWVRRRRHPRLELAVRPMSGARAGWRQRAGVGRAGPQVLAADGWGRYAVLTGTRPASATATVASAPDAVVLVGEDGRAVARLPAGVWSAGDESAPAAARRVAAALDLPLSGRPAPPGGEVLVDPEPPPLAVPLTVAGLAAVPFALGLLLGLDPLAAGARVPLAVVGLLGVTGTALAATVLAGERAAASSGAVPAPGRTTWREWLEVTHPLWAGLGTVLLLLVLRIAPGSGRGVLAGLLVWLAVVGGLGVLLALRRRSAARAWRLACLVPAALVAAPLGLLGLRSADEVPAAWLAAAVGVAGLVAAVVVLGQRGPGGAVTAVRRPRTPRSS